MTSLNYYNLFVILINFRQKLRKSKERGNKNGIQVTRRTKSEYCST